MPPRQKPSATPTSRQETTLTKQLAAAADRLYTTRLERLALQKQVDALAKQEGEAREFIINNLSKNDAKGITGKVAQAIIKMKKIARVADWEAFSAYVLKTKRLDLLQRRVSDEAIMELWEDNKKVPGVEPFDVVSVSCTKA